MKIGFVLDDTLDTPDGVQQYVLTIGPWLAAHGHEVHYLVGKTTRTDIDNVHSLSRNVKVRFNGNRMSMPLPASKARIRELLSRERFDVLHIQMPYSPLLAQRVILAAPRSTAVVGTFHIAPNSGLVHHANRALAVLSRPSLRRFQKVMSVSAAAAEFADRTYGIASMVVPNAVDVQRFAAAGGVRQPKEKTVVFLGRLVPRKGCATLLEAVWLLKQTDPELRFLVRIGGKGPLLADLQQYVQTRGLQDQVHFDGFIHEDDKAGFLQSADIAVFPSTGGESFGIVLLEAMAARNPVVLAADNPGYAAVMNAHPASLFPVRDAGSLAEKIRINLTDAMVRQEALNWQAGYIPQFDSAEVAHKVLDVYKQALETARQS